MGGRISGAAKTLPKGKTRPIDIGELLFDHATCGALNTIGNAKRTKRTQNNLSYRYFFPLLKECVSIVYTTIVELGGQSVTYRNSDQVHVEALTAVLIVGRLQVFCLSSKFLRVCWFQVFYSL